MNSRRHIKTLYILFYIISSLNISAQMIGSYSIPGSFSDLATAISSLNTVGVSGPVTINIQAGHTETVPVGGYSLTATGTATSAIVFQKSGSGANPLFTAPTGTALYTASIQDAVFSLIGSDYITLDGLDIVDPNTTNPATMEYGIVLFKASAVDGCQYNTIKNCVISLSRNYSGFTAGSIPGGAKAIGMINALATSNTVALTITAQSGTSSHNKFYSNILQQCHAGFILYGYSSGSTSFRDIGNDIGGLLAVTGNTLINFGGGSNGIGTNGIYAYLQGDVNISNNLINNNTGSGSSHNYNLGGISLVAPPNLNVSVNNNTLILQGGGNASGYSGIAVSGNIGTTNTVSVSNNVITNCAFTSTSTNTQYKGILCNIPAAFLDISGNRITNTSFTGNGGTLIESGPGLNTTVNSNTISAIAATGTTGLVTGLDISGAVSVTVANNIIEDIMYSATVGSGNLRGIANLNTTSNVFVSNNNIRNFAVPSTGTISGIYEQFASGTTNIQNNQIYNFTTTAGGQGGSNLFGIQCHGGTNTISGNSIYSLTTNWLSGTASSTVAGIFLNGGLVSEISKNKIHTLSSASPSVQVRGIYINGVADNLFGNNIIGNLLAPASTGTLQVSGIHLLGSSLNRGYNNTVYLNASSTGTTFGSTSIYAAIASTLDIRNNILVNTSTASGVLGLSSVFRRDGNDLTKFDIASDNNLFYAGVPSSTNVIFHNGITSYSTLASYKQHVDLHDVYSITENPNWISTVPSNTNYLNINTTTTTQIESGGTPLLSITDDYAGNPRNSATPDIGAWEGNFTGADLQGPGVKEYGFSGSTCNLSSRTFTALIKDISGVAGGTLSPKLYYRANANTYTVSTGILSTGTASNGVWSFNMNYTVNPMDSIYAHIVTQDALTLPNVRSYPETGFTGTDVNTVLTAPAYFMKYRMQHTLSGTYTVGTAGTFTTLSDAAYAYSNGCIAGSMTFVLNKSNFSAGETFPIVFKENPLASSTTSLLILPTPGLHVYVVGTSTAMAVIKFEDVNYITMDGLNASGSHIEVQNNNSSNSAAIWLASSLTKSCTNITLRNLDLENVASTNQTIYGLIASSPTSFTVRGSYNNLLIENNTIYRGYDGINFIGSNLNKIKQCTINGNSIGGVRGAGIRIIYVENTTVNLNTIGSITTLTADAGGIYASSIYSSSISQNTIQNINTISSTGWNGLVSGITLEGFGVNSYITKNVIKQISSTVRPAKGIYVNMPSSPGPNYIQNNFISGILSDPDINIGSSPIGIDVTGNNLFIENNSVSLYGLISASTGNTGSSPILVNSSSNGLTIRNNILSNTMSNSFSTGESVFAFYSLGTSGAITNMDHNNFYVGGLAPNQILAYSYGNLLTLSSIQTGLGGNLNSKTLTPVFVGADDLHIKDDMQNLAFDNLGTPVSGITDDIDFELRNTTTPDIGADEFTIHVCTTGTAGTLPAISGCAGETFTISPIGTDTGFTMTYQWKIATSAGGPYTNAVSGSTATPYFVGNLGIGTYYYKLEATCNHYSLSTTSSNETTLTVFAIPSVTASVATPTLCSAQTLSLIASAPIGANYAWIGPGNYTSAVQNPLIANAAVYHAGTYSVQAQLNGCWSPKSTISVSITGTPFALALSPPSISLCAGNSQSITLSGGLQPAAFNFTSQVSQNTTNTYPAPYSAYYGGQKMQFLVLASELTAAGLVAGPINSIQFPAVSTGTNWGTSINALQNFQVSMGNTSLNSVGATFQTGLTIVASATTYTPFVGYGNTHVFNTPFNWNGTSNVIIETVFSNNSGGGTGNAVIQYNSPTSFQSTMVFVDNNGTFTSVAAATSTNMSTPLRRPDFKLNGVGLSSYSWSPSAGLSSSSGTAVTANPTVTTTYSVLASNGACTNSNSALVQVTPIPTLAISSTGTAVCAGNSATLTASGAATYTWNTASNSNSISVNPLTATIYTVSNQTAPCPLVTATLAITVNTLPVVSIAASSNTICSGQLYTLTASGAASYTWNTGLSANQLTIAPNVTTTYSVNALSNDACAGTATLAITPNPVPAPLIAQSAASVCPGSVVSLTASGANTYMWNTFSTNSIISVSPLAPTIYTVSASNALGCSSTQTAAIGIYAIPAIVITPASATVCAMGSVTFTATGANTYTWNGTLNTSTILLSPQSNTVYSIGGTEAVNGCTASINVPVTIQQPPVILISSSSASACPGASVTFTATGANTYTWQSPGTNGSVLTVTPTAPSVYSVSGSGNFGCVSNKTVSVGLFPATTILAGPSQQTICAGEIATFTASGANTYLWMPGNTSGSTFTISPTSSESYTVTGTDVNNCSAVKNFQLVVDECVGIQENLLANFVKVFPNPSNGKVNVIFSKQGDKIIQLLNPEGRIIEVRKTMNDEEAIDFSGYAKGLYFLQISMGSSSLGFKLVIH